MATVTLEIINAGGYYHAYEKVVAGGDDLEIKTSLAGVFTIVFNNKDSFFTSGKTLIEVDVDSTSGSVHIGTVNSGTGKYVKDYDIHGSVAVQIPDLDAPPRIIRVAS